MVSAVRLSYLMILCDFESVANIVAFFPFQVVNVYTEDNLVAVF